MRIRTLIVIAAIITMPLNAFAQDPIHKFGRGVVNVLTGWIEIPKQIHIGSQQDNNLTGAIVGVGKGIANAVLRLGVGLYEAVSAPAPYPRGFISPYQDLQLPDYAWE